MTKKYVVKVKIEVKVKYFSMSGAGVRCCAPHPRTRGYAPSTIQKTDAENVQQAQPHCLTSHAEQHCAKETPRA